MTEATKALFTRLVTDAPNWNGSPLADVTTKTRGNLTHLKQAGLLKTMVDDGCTWVTFTDKGIEYAKELGHDLSWIEPNMRAR